MATYVPAKRGVAYRTWVGLVSQATRPQFQSSATLAAGDVKVSKDGGALANLTTLPVVTPAASKLVQVDLSATEMTADIVTVIFSDAAGAEWDDLILVIPTVARQIDDLAFSNVSGRGIDVSATGEVDANVVTWLAAAVSALVAGRVDASVGAMAAAVLTAAAIAADAIDNTKIAAGAITSSEAPNLDAAVSSRAIAGDAMALTAAAINLIFDELTAEARVAGSYGQLLKDNLNAAISSRAVPGDLMGLVAGAITSAKFAAGAIDAAALAADAATEIRSLASGVADSGTATTMVDAARTEADIDYWKGQLVLFTSGTLLGQARLVTAFDPVTDTITFAPATTVAVAVGHTYEILPAGRVDLHSWLGAVVNALITGRVDANAQVIGLDAVDAAALKLDAGQEIADRVLARGIAGGADGGRTVTSALRRVRNRNAIVAGTLTTYQEDDITPDHTAAVTTAPGDPVTSIDPV